MRASKRLISQPFPLPHSNLQVTTGGGKITEVRADSFRFEMGISSPQFLNWSVLFLESRPTVHPFGRSRSG